MPEGLFEGFKQAIAKVIAPQSEKKAAQEQIQKLFGLARELSQLQSPDNPEHPALYPSGVTVKEYGPDTHKNIAKEYIVTIPASGLDMERRKPVATESIHIAQTTAGELKVSYYKLTDTPTQNGHHEVVRTKIPEASESSTEFLPINRAYEITPLPEFLEKIQKFRDRVREAQKPTFGLERGPKKPPTV